jgi:hypothetical protein
MSALAKAHPIEVADLETYLFGRVGPHFVETGKISKEDFWLILIWKSNRSKNNTRRALERDGKTFEEAVIALACSIHGKQDHKDKLIELVIHKHLGLATSSAILTVFYPDFFTVYDDRVCGQLGGDHKKLGYCRHPERLWDGYKDFVKAVNIAVPTAPQLREKDKTLWGQSLLDDIDAELGKDAPQRLLRNDWNTKEKQSQ